MDPQIIRLYDEYTHAPLERRVFLDRLTKLTGSASAALALVPLLEANQALADLQKQAEETTANDPLVQSARQALDEAGKKLDEAKKLLAEALKNNPQQRARPSPPPRSPPPRRNH